MKNLKKVLSLVLALAMALSLMTVAFAKDASDYTDYGTITNKEAVDVLTALNVIDGMGNNTFQPTGNVTRAQMAKMITIISLGNVDPTAFLGTVTDLKDINGHWAEAYIKYCYSQGIISGRGNGIFDPNANVTSAEASKMLLTAIGYNAKVQGYTGEQWAINVTRDAQTSGFYAGVSVPANKALTRDEAAQMIYNAVDATLIQKTSSVDRTDGSIIDSYAPYTDGRDLLKETFKVTTTETALNATSYNAEKSEYEYTMNSAVNGSTTIKSAADYSDLFGMNVKVMWTENKAGDTVIYGIYPNKSTVVAECVIGDLDTTKVVSDSKLLVGTTEYKTDGNSLNMFVKFNNATELGTAVGEPAAQYYSAKLIDKDGNGKVDFVVYYPATIAKVTYVGKTNVTLNGTYGGSTLTVKNDTIYTGIAKDDYVVVTTGLDGYNTVEKLDTKFTAAITKIEAYDSSATTKATKLVAGGNTYKVADVAKDTITSAAIGKDMTAVVYNGYLFYTDTSSTIGIDKFAMVINAEATATGLNKNRQAELLFTDGTKKTVDVAADYKTTTPLINKMVTFSVTDGVYTLKNATGATGTDFATNGGYAGGTETYNKTTGKTTNGYTVSDTAVIFAKDSKGNWIVTTGAEVKKGNNAITQGFYKTSTATGYSSIELGVVNGAVAVSNSNYAVVTSAVSTVADADSNKVAELTIWTVDGAKTITTTNTYTDVVTTKAIAKGSVITYTDKGNNVITIDSVVSMTESAVVAYNPVANGNGENDIAFSDGAASSGKTALTSAVDALIDKDTVILYIDKNGSDYTGIEGGEIRLATETSTTDTFYTNVAYNGTANVKVLVVEVDNNFSDVTM